MVSKNENLEFAKSGELRERGSNRVGNKADICVPRSKTSSIKNGQTGVIERKKLNMQTLKLKSFEVEEMGHSLF